MRKRTVIYTTIPELLDLARKGSNTLPKREDIDMLEYRCQSLDNCDVNDTGEEVVLETIPVDVKTSKPRKKVSK